ncbi:MAG: IS110 family transposase [Sphingobacteriales bacterium]|nr:MAG: IS110 family transposase [Sphingobacteriales bacterium]
MVMKSIEMVCGVDVSKDHLDLCFNDKKNIIRNSKVENNARGHAALIKKLGIHRTYVMESSGPYCVRLAFKLRKMGADVRVESALVVKRFIQMHMERNKSDKKDAAWPYRFGQEREATKWRMPSREQTHCAQMLSSIELMKRQTTMLSNHLHSLDQLPVYNRDVKLGLQRAQKKLANEIAKLEDRLVKTLDEWQSEQRRNLITIPGLGNRAAALLIVHTDGFKNVTNHRQLSALAGLVPREYTSGSSVRGKKGICKMGNARLRNVLYMCSMSAIKYNKACRELYDRLRAAGKNGKVALIAVCNKLLKQAFAIATKGIAYQDEYRSTTR